MDVEWPRPVVVTWIELGAAPGFGPANLPYGVVSLPGDGRRRVVVAIGEQVLDVGACAAAGGHPHADLLGAATLDPLLAAGRGVWTAVRGWLTDLVTDPRHRPLVAPHLHPRATATAHLPFTVADYVDFYSSAHHAANVGRILRGTDALPEAWWHLPIGYHGRAGTVVVSGTDVVRPWGQARPPGGGPPVHGPSTRLDVEVEIGFVVGVGSRLGHPVPPAAFTDHVFGICLLNDWSARDLQAFEYRPLGPFLGKSFATSVSPWIVPLDALQGARVAPPEADLPPPAHLQAAEPWGLDLQLELVLNGTVVARPPFATMAWTAPQQLAHLTSNGASLRTGDLFASGTVSGPEPGQRGCLLELTWDGADPVVLADGTRRAFLADGDQVVIRGTAPAVDGGRLDLGEVAGTVVPRP